MGICFIATHKILSNQVCPSLFINTEKEDYEKIIENAVTEPFFLESVTYVSDVQLDKSEFDYLVNLKEKTYVAADDLKKSVCYLIKKNKFQTIVLHFEATDIGTFLTFEFTSFWTFERVSLAGVMIGKDRFLQYYDMQPGEKFEEQKHKRCVAELKKAFAREGYFDSSVEDLLVRNEKTKSVVVKIALNKGSRFVIDQLSVDYVKMPHVSVHESEILCTKVKKFLHKKLKEVVYSKKHVQDEINSLKHYLSKKGFMYVHVVVSKDIDYENKKVAVRFKLELQHKREFVFFGNHFFSERQLLDFIFVFGRSAWLLPSTILSEELIKEYQKKGFWNIVIDSREEDNRYFFIIKEGERAVISHIELMNVHSFAAEKIIKDCFGEVLKAASYDESMLKKSYEKLIDWYARQGFWQATIVKDEYVKLQNDSCYMLRIFLNEGEKSTVIKVEVADYPELEKEFIFKHINKKDGATVTLDSHLITQQRQWLLNYFQGQGYIHVDINHELQRDADNNVILRWSINPGQKVRFGKTIVLDALGFPFDCIMNEIVYKEGELWDREKLKRSLLNIKELEIFDIVHLYPSEIAQQEPEKAILIRLQKDSPFELRMRVGCGVQQVDRHLSTAGFTYKFGSTFIVKNPFNIADLLKVETDFSRSRRSAIVCYRLPRLGGLPFRTEFKGYSSKYLYPGCIGTSKNLYQIKQEGFLFGARSIKNCFDLGFNVGLEVMRTALSDQKKETKSMAERVSRALNFDMALLDKYIPYFVVEPIVLINNLDNPLNPQKGTFTVFSFKSMIPFGSHKKNAFFVRVNCEQSFFIPLKPFVIVFHMRFGHIFLQDFKHIMPSQRFYLGGANSIRSYVTDRCPPLGIVIDECGKEHLVPQGGKSLANLNIELRFPLIKGIGIALFQDIGFLSDTKFADVSRDRMLTGTGFGLYYVTPVGPLRFDFACKWHNDVPTSRPYAWYLTFGQPF